MPEFTPNILVIDDNPEIGKLMELTLHMEGYDVQVENDSAAALEAARSYQPTLIILDLAFLDDPQGFELAEQFKADPVTADIPILFVTANQEMDAVVHGLELGVDYLTKPFAVLEFSARVRCALRQERRYQQKGLS